MIDRTFEYINPTRLVFGENAFETLGDLLPAFGNRAFIVTGRNYVKKSGLLDRLNRLSGSHNISFDVFDKVDPEPEDSLSYNGFEAFQAAKADLIIGIGGGSVIDIAKSIAVLANNPGPLDKYEQEDSLLNDPAPTIVIPTTAGSGSEHTRYAVLTNSKKGRKYTIKSLRICPNIAIVDPLLTLSLDRENTISSGLDALIHAFEVYLSLLSNPITESLSIKAIELILQHLPRVLTNPKDRFSRAEMSIASTIGGMLINNVRTGLIHTMSVAIGGKIRIKHGILNAIVCPVVLNHLLPYSTQKMAKICHTLGISRDSSAESSAKSLNHFLKDFLLSMDIPNNLLEFSLNKNDIPSLIERVMQDKGLKDVTLAPISSEILDRLFQALI